MNILKTIFVGTPDFGLPSLESLHNNNEFELIGVITQPDKKVGRKQILTPPPIKKRAAELNIPVFQPEKIAQFKDELTKLAPDLIIVIAYAQIIPSNILSIPRLGFINVHGSLLPKYRGAACIQASILNGDKKTGITIMQMDKGLDTGPILSQASIDIAPKDTTEILFDKLSGLGAKILIPTVLDLNNKKITPKSQNNKEASYVKTLKKEDGKIDWSKSSVDIERFIRAMTSWPGAYSFLRKEKVPGQMLKILEAETSETDIKKYSPGEIYISNNILNIKCGKGSLKIIKLQLSGKKATSADDYLRGHGEHVGQILL